MTQEERIDNWQRIISEQEESGVNPRAFCREHNINPSRFYHWRKRLHRKPATGFLQIFPATDPKCPGTDSGIRIHLGSTVSIELARGFDPSALRCVIETLSQCRGAGSCSP